MRLQYLNKKTLKEQPTVYLSYDEGLHLIRSFLEYASHHTVEELQAFTAQWVPHPQWVKVDEQKVSEEHLTRAAELIQAELGEDGIRQVGGRQWWQWRRPKSPLEAEWIEMRSDAHERKKSGEPLHRVMMYVHGGAYYFGSVDEHRYQMQRHARKLKARVFAPRYRLSPQFPFPCGLQDCLAAYLYLLTVQDPSTIILAGDSAGGGMVLSLMCLLRDQGIPLPSGGILISPWVDLTHSFPSVSGEAPLDYIPQSGFHHKPSRAWPPPNDDDLAMLHAETEARKKKGEKKAPPAAELKKHQQGPVAPTSADEPGVHVASDGIQSDTGKFLTVTIDGELITMKDQIQMYTTNALLSHPLVSPVMQPTLGGLPPLLIMVGGGEFLRDEQIYLAHKCANPAKYAPAPDVLTDHGKMLLAKYKPTDVQLQVWDDLCHVTPTLSFTRPAKYMYRSVAQFGAWVLARAQKRGIEIMDDDAISVITSSGSDTEVKKEEQVDNIPQLATPPVEVGKAGDPLPPFKNHMIRQRVTKSGAVLPLPLEEDLPACCMQPHEIGVIKEGPVRKWLGTKKQYDSKYSSAKAKVHKKIIKEMVTGFRDFGPNECPPPSALAGRIPVDSELSEVKKKKSIGLALWSLWGSKHDEMTVVREQKATHEPEVQAVTAAEGSGARSHSEIKNQSPARPMSRSKMVHDENQTGDDADESTPVAHLLAMRREREASHAGLLSPDYSPETGVAGKRPFLDGIALPFTLRNEAATASMVTLYSDTGPTGSRPPSPSGFGPALTVRSPDEEGETTQVDNDAQRPPMETFLTAKEELPQVSRVDGENGHAVVSAN
ncbi:AB hydrolase superfamily protein C4A8.06c [Cladobotryum mycophilum]|uniref:AB hydrolase superfamily protein C4A8.06c n=1 Tax=Cladobotryum mycophilum TaxID=491253 RepID=A0ABR0SS84_9HYPO